MVWNTTGKTKQGYGFSYDGLNRLKTSSYGEGASFASYAGANNENYAYDLNGNLTSLTRYLRGTGQIDLLTYTYKNSGASNQLDRVDDTATYPTIGFYNGVSTTGEYGYDPNGNLTSDLNKGYNTIAYNYLNLPKKVGTTSQYIRYIYSADGTKLAKVGTGGVYTYYPGRFVYSESSLTMILTSEGKVLPGGSYQYFLKDHLGNTRMVVSSTGSIVQQTDYYPFGLEIASYTGGTENKYLYNGKLERSGNPDPSGEKQDDLINSRKLDWYDYGARFFDPSIGRWHTTDQMAEKGPFISPYAYCFNNPIKLVDPDGQWPRVTNIFMQGNIGVGLGYGLYAVQQSGIAYDDYGKTHFTMTGTAYLVNQNLEEGSRNPNFVLGADAGLSVGVSQDWSSNSFVESVGKSNQISAPGPTIKGSLGIGISGNENSASLSIGLQAGGTFNTMGMNINESISLTDTEASKVGRMTDVVTESWTVKNVSAVKNKDGNITGYSGNVFTKNTKGEFINTGVKVNSSIVKNDGRVSSNNIWISPSYQRKLNEDNK